MIALMGCSRCIPVKGSKVAGQSGLAALGATGGYGRAERLLGHWQALPWSNWEVRGATHSMEECGDKTEGRGCRAQGTGRTELTESPRFSHQLGRGTTGV